MSIYKVGDKVMIKPSMVDDFVGSTSNKLRDRVGFIKGLSYPSERPIVVFPAQGRKKEFNFGITHDAWLVPAPGEIPNE